MNFNLAELRKLDAFDILLLAVFIIYIVFQVDTPQAFIPFIESPIGLVVLFAVAVSLFVYKNPILGVLFIFVAYELLRRNQHNAPASPVVDSVMHMANRIPTPLPKTQSEKNSKLNAMNHPVEKSLEEEIVQKEVAVGKSEVAFTETAFHPVMDKSDLGMTVY